MFGMGFGCAIFCSGLRCCWFMVVVTVGAAIGRLGELSICVFDEKWTPFTGGIPPGCTNVSSMLAGDQNVVEVGKSWNMEFSPAKLSFFCPNVVVCVEFALDFDESSIQSSQTPFLLSLLLPFCSSMREVGKNRDVARDDSLCLKSTGDNDRVFWPKSAISS